jgi:hypothetical protein
MSRQCYSITISLAAYVILLRKQLACLTACLLKRVVRVVCLLCDCCLLSFLQEVAACCLSCLHSCPASLYAVASIVDMNGRHPCT